MYICCRNVFFLECTKKPHISCALLEKHERQEKEEGGNLSENILYDF